MLALILLLVCIALLFGLTAAAKVGIVLLLLPLALFLLGAIIVVLVALFKS